MKSLKKTFLCLVLSVALLSSNTLVFASTNSNSNIAYTHSSNGTQFVEHGSQVSDSQFEPYALPIAVPLVFKTIAAAAAKYLGPTAYLVSSSSVQQVWKNASGKVITFSTQNNILWQAKGALDALIELIK